MTHYGQNLIFLSFFFSVLQSAINLTSTLLKDASNLDNSNVNILVSCEKLEKFAMEYANLHMTSQNGSEAEISIEQEELGSAFLIVSSNYSFLHKN